MHIGIRFEKARLRKGYSRRAVNILLKGSGIKVPQTFLRDLETTGMSRHTCKALPVLCKIYGISISNIFEAGVAEGSIVESAKLIKEQAQEILKYYGQED